MINDRVIEMKKNDEDDKEEAASIYVGIRFWQMLLRNRFSKGRVG